MSDDLIRASLDEAFLALTAMKDDPAGAQVHATLSASLASLALLTGSDPGPASASVGPTATAPDRRPRAATSNDHAFRQWKADLAMLESTAAIRDAEPVSVLAPEPMDADELVDQRQMPPARQRHLERRGRPDAS